MSPATSSAPKVKLVPKRWTKRTATSIGDKTSQESSSELMHLRDINAITSAQLYELTMEKIELKAKVRDLEFENKKLELENLELLNRIDDHYKLVENLSTLLGKHRKLYQEPVENLWSTEPIDRSKVREQWYHRGMSWIDILGSLTKPMAVHVTSFIACLDQLIQNTTLNSQIT